MTRVARGLWTDAAASLTSLSFDTWQHHLNQSLPHLVKGVDHGPMGSSHLSGKSRPLILKDVEVTLRQNLAFKS